MKKFIAFFMVMCLCFFTLFAAGETESQKDSTKVVTLWTCWLDKGDLALLEAFNASHTDVQVEWELIAFKDYATKIVAAAKTNQLPDVLRLQPKAPAQYGQAGFLLPVNSIIEDNNWSDVYPENFLKSNTIDGNLYGIPFYCLPHLLFYRADLMKNIITPPTNWEEFKTAAKALTKDGIVGYATTLNDPSVGHTVHQWMGSNNADTFGPGLELTIDSPETVEVINFLNSLYQEGCMNKDVASAGNNEFRMLFQSGKAAMGISSSSLIGILVNDEEMRKNVGVLPIPKNDPNGKNYAAFHSYSISSQCKDLDAAKEFLTWINTPENQIIYFREGTRFGDIPVRSDMTDLYRKIEKLQPYMNLLEPAIETSKAGWTPGMAYGVTEYPGLFDTQNIYQQMVLKTILGEATAEESVAWAKNKMSEIMSE